MFIKNQKDIINICKLTDEYFSIGVLDLSLKNLYFIELFGICLNTNQKKNKELYFIIEEKFNNYYNELIINCLCSLLKIINKPIYYDNLLSSYNSIKLEGTFKKENKIKEFNYFIRKFMNKLFLYEIMNDDYKVNCYYYHNIIAEFIYFLEEILHFNTENMMDLINERFDIIQDFKKMEDNKNE